MCDVCRGAHHEPQVSRRDFLRTVQSRRLYRGRPHRGDPAPGAPPLPNAIAPGDALKHLMGGNARYAAIPNERDVLIGPRRARRGNIRSPRS
jgi:carbonic anhydrase